MGLQRQAFWSWKAVTEAAPSLVTPDEPQSMGELGEDTPQMTAVAIKQYVAPCSRGYYTL